MTATWNDTPLLRALCTCSSSEAFKRISCEVLKHKFRDTWLYRWAQGKADKPVRYLCLLTLDSAMLSVRSKELRQQLPVGLAGPNWSGALAQSCVVLNLERWNANFPKWQAARLVA